MCNMVSLAAMTWGHNALVQALCDAQVTVVVAI